MQPVYDFQHHDSNKYINMRLFEQCGQFSSNEELAGQNKYIGEIRQGDIVNYLNDQSVLVALRGIIHLNSYNEIRPYLAKMLKQKVSSIVLQISDIIDIEI
jgi:hypothetical protein